MPEKLSRQIVDACMAYVFPLMCCFLFLFVFLHRFIRNYHNAKLYDKIVQLGIGIPYGIMTLRTFRTIIAKFSGKNCKVSSTK